MSFRNDFSECVPVCLEVCCHMCESRDLPKNRTVFAKLFGGDSFTFGPIDCFLLGLELRRTFPLAPDMKKVQFKTKAIAFLPSYVVWMYPPFSPLCVTGVSLCASVTALSVRKRGVAFF